MPEAALGCRGLRRGCVVLAHLAALGMTALLFQLARPGTSEAVCDSHGQLEDIRCTIPEVHLEEEKCGMMMQPCAVLPKTGDRMEVHNQKEKGKPKTALHKCAQHGITKCPLFACLFCTYVHGHRAPVTNSFQRWGYLIHIEIVTRTKVQMHWTAETLALLSATLGLVFIISSKNRSELPHFVSWHSLLGLLTLVATCGQVLCGLCLHFPHLLRMSSTASLQLYHRTCGLVVYLLATFTVILAIYSDWFQAQIRGLAWYFYLALPICPALVVMNQISRTRLPKKTQYV
ncbi:hypothetical protein JRQ81_015069 [Phrynocephalus forsythii]|uniref:ascorbate ferrireductase (transmembrane) n=1 Tax=Phrynocephalus forsythii TaxID=171643 RepID=A0A9Q0XXU3_9SAUR|nr:hypothetical protein JRQ81_015069 [Phrynocephalus forsythii]